MSIRLNYSNIGEQAKAMLEVFAKSGRSMLEMMKEGKGEGKEFTGWINLPFSQDKIELERLKNAAEKIKSDSDVLVVIGIGGSYLGAKAAIDFIKSPNYNLLNHKTPEVYFAGNGLSDDALAELIEIIGDRDFSVNVISKSGTTTEPAVAFRVFREMLEKKYGKDGASRRIYATTDRQRGALRSLSEQNGYETFVIPDDIGGRYSVFTPVGLLPMAVAGIDVDDVMKGAAAAIERYVFGADGNDALTYAAIRNTLYNIGKKAEIFSFFEPRVKYTAEWWKQLFGESEGKQNKGILPYIAEYTADLHSMGQYIQEGERFLFETFVEIKNPRSAVTVPFNDANTDCLNYLAGKTLGYINEKAMLATEQAHFDGGVPNMRITVDRADEYAFGELAEFFCVACAVSAYVLGVNPFNQPGVEAYKKNMFRLLGKPEPVAK